VPTSNARRPSLPVSRLRVRQREEVSTTIWLRESSLGFAG
jgi:hypothetical protein